MLLTEHTVYWCPLAGQTEALLKMVLFSNNGIEVMPLAREASRRSLVSFHS